MPNKTMLQNTEHKYLSFLDLHLILWIFLAMLLWVMIGNFIPEAQGFLNQFQNSSTNLLIAAVLILLVNFAMGQREKINIKGEIK